MSENRLENALNALADKLSSEEIEPILSEIESLQQEITEQKSSLDALESENRELTELVEMLNGSDKELRQARMQKEDNAREAQSLKERETTLVSDQQQLNRDKAVLASNEEDYEKRMKEYKRINADQEKELNRRLKSHKENLTKKLEQKYSQKEKSLESAYNDKNKALWSVVLAISAAALIPLIGIIINVAENAEDFGRFLAPFKALADMIALWTGADVLAPIMLIVICLVVVAVLAGLSVWYSRQVTFAKKYFCIALAVFEVLLAVNPFLPSEYNPFWVTLVLYVGGIAITIFVKN